MSWQEIGSTTLSAAAPSVTFSSGLSGYKFFRLTIYIVNDANSGQATVTLNGASTAYAEQRVQVASTTVIGSRSAPAYLVATDGIGANHRGNISLLIAKPAAGVKAQGILQSGQGDTTAINLNLNGGEWDNTADLISSITINKSSGNFAAGTSILLEGLAA